MFLQGVGGKFLAHTRAVQHAACAVVDERGSIDASFLRVAQHGVDALSFEGGYKLLLVIRAFQHESEAGAKTGYVDKALSADKLKTARAVTLAGAITGNTTFDGSKDISIETSLKPLEEQDIPELSLSKIKDAGTAAACNTGTEAGQIPVIGEGGKLNEALIPQQTLTTDNVNEGKKNLYYTNERVTNYLQDTANTFVMDGGNA